MSNADLIQQFYTAIRNSDADALAKCVSATFALEWQGTASIPWAGHWHGVSGLLKFFEILNAHIKVLEVTQRHKFEDDKVTVVILQGKWSVIKTGHEISALASNIFTFDEGLIASYTVINNSAAFAEDI